MSKSTNTPVDPPEKTSAAGYERDAKGRIKPGASLNPGGKPKDMATRKECQKYLFSRGPELVDQAIAYATTGKPSSEKMLMYLLDKILPGLHPMQVSDSEEGSENKGQAWTVAQLRRSVQ